MAAAIFRWWQMIYSGGTPTVATQINITDPDGGAVITDPDGGTNITDPGA